MTIAARESNFFAVQNSANVKREMSATSAAQSCRSTPVATGSHRERRALDQSVYSFQPETLAKFNRTDSRLNTDTVVIKNSHDAGLTIRVC